MSCLAVVLFGVCCVVLCISNEYWEPGFGGGLGWFPKPPPGLAFPPVGDVWPVPDGGEAASLLGPSPEHACLACLDSVACLACLA